VQERSREVEIVAPVPVLIRHLMIYRMKRGISQTELARRARISQSQLCDYENGRHTPSVKVVEDLARALGLEFQLVITPPEDQDESGYGIAA